MGFLDRLFGKQEPSSSVVAKEREVVVTGRTRIHLDNVEGLGHFIELETVVGDIEGDGDAATELHQVSAMLGLDAFPAVAGSYIDLIEGVERA